MPSTGPGTWPVPHHIESRDHGAGALEGRETIIPFADGPPSSSAMWSDRTGTVKEHPVAGSRRRRRREPARSGRFARWR
eukprot:6224447-Prymnesium_polylepis.1